MNNLLRKIAIGSVILGLGVIALPALGAISAGCRADLNTCTSAELTEYIAELTASLTALQAQLGQQTTTPAAGDYGVPAGFTFTKNLSAGMSDPDVVNLKKVLDVEVPDHAAWTGSDYFASKTKAAVVKFQQKYSADISAAAGYTIKASGFVGTGTRTKLNALLAGGLPVGCNCTAWVDGACGTGDNAGKRQQTRTCTPSACAAESQYVTDATCVVTPVSAGLTVTLAPDTPAAGNFPAGGSQIPFVKLNFSAGSNDVTVTAMNVYRGGLSSDNDISNVYLMEGSSVLATNLGLSNGKANFSASVGLFTVKAGTTKAITVAADIASSGTAGHTFTFSVNAASDVTANDTVNGTFPISGNTFAAVSVSNPSLATLTLNNIATGGSVNAGTNNFLAGQFSLQSANSAVSVKSIKLTETGTINAAADLANIKLMNGATPVGATIASLNADGTVVFDLSSNPLQIASGVTVILSVYADVVGGVNRNFRFTIQRAYDVVATDMTYNVGATVSATLPVSASLVSISSGSLVIAKSANSPVNYIAAGATNATLASFDFKASGEAIRVTAITYQIGGYTSGAETTVWNNLKLVDDQGVQIGTVTTAGSTVGTSKSVALSSLNYIIPANTTRVLSIKADIVSTYSGNVVGSITSGTAQGYTSLAAITIGSYTGNTLSSAVTPFAVAINNAVGPITTVSGASNIKVGSFTLSAGAAEGINVTSISFTTGADVLNKLQNLVVKYGASQIGITQATLANSTAYTFSPSSPIAIALGGQVVIDVYADTVSGVTSSAAAVLLSGSQGTGASTNVSRTATGVSATGQVVTINAAGTLTTALASPAVVSQQVSMGVTTVKLGSFKLSANNNENIDVTGVAVQSTSTRAQDIVNVKLMSGTTQYGQTISGVAGATTTTTFVLTTPLSVPQNSYVVLDVLADINTLTGGAVSTDTITIGLGTVNYQGAASKASNSVTAAVNSGATFTVYMTSMTPAIGPTFTAPVSLSDGAIVGQFNITAGAANDVILKTISLSQAGSLIQATSSVLLKVYGSNAPTTLLGTTTATSTNTYAIALNSPTGWTVAKGLTQYLIVKADLASAASTLVTTSPSTKSYQISVRDTVVWNDGVTDITAINPTIITPINGQAISFSF